MERKTVSLILAVGFSILVCCIVAQTVYSIVSGGK